MKFVVTSKFRVVELTNGEDVPFGESADRYECSNLFQVGSAISNIIDNLVMVKRAINDRLDKEAPR